MRDFTGKTAFITGGGAGIGFALARVFLREGMNVVAADIRDDHLAQAATSLAGAGAALHLMKLDVTDRDAMTRAAEETMRRFGPVHVLCNNAGVSNRIDADLASFADWDWVLGVNLGGVINGIGAFMPGMKAHGQGGHIVNTGSVASLAPRQGKAGVYTTSKFAVLGLTASLRYVAASHGIGVSLLCPGQTKTRIGESEKTRPARFASDTAPPPRESFGATGMEPADVAERVLNGIRNNDPYIFTTSLFLNDEVREFHAEIEAALPQVEAQWPGFAEYDSGRRRQIAEGKAKLAAAQGKFWPK